jgi:hypothetical protein
MARRRRNKLVLWEWSDGSDKPAQNPGRRSSVGREAFGAALLLGAIIFLLSRIPDAGDGYRRDRLARYFCEVAGTNPDTPQCIAVSIGGWFVIVVSIGIFLKFARSVLNARRPRKDES